MNLWSQLPSDLIHQITNLLTLPNQIKFGCVCTSWQSHSPPTQHKGHLPWLLLPLQNNSPDSGNSWPNSLQFYSILDKEFRPLDLPEIKDRRICGSSNGWLITIHDNSDIYLFHPFSKKLVELPSLNNAPGVCGIQYDNGLQYLISDSIGRKRDDAQLWISKVARDEYIVKVIVGLNDNVVIGILGELRRLFVCRRETNDHEWRMIEDDKDGMYMDVCFYKEEFYAVDMTGNVVVVDCNELCTRKIINGNENGSQKVYLVESLGELLKVVRLYGPAGEESDDLEVEDGEPRLMKTVGFEVWKVDFEQGLLLEVKNLGDRALFLGIYHSSLISSSEFPGCKGNCIYFTGDYWEMNTGGNDRGICNLENGRIEAIFTDGDSKMILPQPIWYSSIHGQS